VPLSARERGETVLRSAARGAQAEPPQLEAGAGAHPAAPPPAARRRRHVHPVRRGFGAHTHRRRCAASRRCGGPCGLGGSRSLQLRLQAGSGLLLSSSSGGCLRSSAAGLLLPPLPGAGVKCGGAMMRDVSIYCVSIFSVLVAFWLGRVTQVGRAQGLALCCGGWVGGVAACRHPAALLDRRLGSGGSRPRQVPRRPKARSAPAVRRCLWAGRSLCTRSMWCGCSAATSGTSAAGRSRTCRAAGWRCRARWASGGPLLAPGGGARGGAAAMVPARGQAQCAASATLALALGRRRRRCSG
jgi:hypothetical protein